MSSDHLTMSSKVTENPKPAWLKPTIRTMTVSFTEDGDSGQNPRNNPEDINSGDGSDDYTPVTS